MNVQTKYIYFDIGGVVIFDYSDTNKWFEMISDLRLSPEDAITFLENWRLYEPDICIGKKTTEDFIDHIQSKISTQFPKNYSMINDFVNRFERNIPLQKLIKEIGEDYRIGLLTNMYPDMLNKITIKGLLGDIVWDTIIDSSIVGLRKPQQEIYVLAEEKSGFREDSILFIDNRLENIEAATDRGWKTLSYKPRDSLESNKELIKFLEL